MHGRQLSSIGKRHGKTRHAPTRGNFAPSLVITKSSDSKSARTSIVFRGSGQEDWRRVSSFSRTLAALAQHDCGADRSRQQCISESAVQRDAPQ